MKAFDLDRNIRWLFCLTHPDDELAIAAWIRRLTLAGCEVFMSWTHDTPIRMQEAHRAAKLLGVPATRLFFHHAPDGGVIDSLENLYPSFTGMVQQVKPDRVVCCAFEQGHIDHDATNYLVNNAFTGHVLEVPLYHTYLTRFPVLNTFATEGGQELLHLDQEDIGFKIMLAKQYPSQTIWRNVFWYEIWQTVRFRPRHLAKIERMRFQTHKDFMMPNLPGPLSDKVRKCSTWKRWEHAVKQFETVRQHAT